jgi:branched-chain amino acid transport system substrate-binding protein
MKRMHLFAVGSVAAVLTMSPALSQEVTIGMTGTFTGPNAAIGQGYKMASELFPTSVVGVPIKWIILDDGGDATTAVKNARRFVDQDKVDVILGSNSPPSATAMFVVANESATAQVALGPVDIPASRQPWVFCIPHTVPPMVAFLVEDMRRRGVKTVGYIGFTDIWGDQNWKALNESAAAAGIKVVAGERYNRTDTSVTAQALKIMSANPDAVYIGGAATPAALPHRALKDLGYRGQIYHSFGSISKPFLQAGGAALEGLIAPTGPIVVAAELDGNNPIKKVAIDFASKFEVRFGKGSVNPYAGYAWDGMLVVTAAIQEAIKKAKPGTAEFRAAMKAALENGHEVIGTHAVYRFTPSDHYGGDARARVLVTVRNGEWRLVK